MRTPVNFSAVQTYLHQIQVLHTVHHFLKQLDAYREIQLSEKQQLECLPAQDNSTPGFSEKKKSAELQYCQLEENVGVFYIFHIPRTEDPYKNLCFNLQVKLQPTETVPRQRCQPVRDGNGTTMQISPESSGPPSYPKMVSLLVSEGFPQVF